MTSQWRTVICKRQAGSQSDPARIAIRVRILHVPGCGAGDILTEVSGNHLQRHIDARRDAGGRDHTAVLDDMLSVFYGDRGEGIAHPVQRPPMSGRMESVQKAGESQQHRSGANGSQCFDFRGTSAQPIEHDPVVQLFACAPPARDDKDIEARTVPECMVRNDLHIAGRNDRVGMLCHQQDFKGGRLFAPFLFVQTDCRENLKGTAEIEDFNIFEKNDTDTFPLHLLPPSDETGAQAEPGGLMVSAGQPSAPVCSYAVNFSSIAFLINRSRIAATPTFRELAFVLLSTTATPGLAFNKVWGFSFTKCRNQFHRSIVIGIVHYPHRWASIRGKRNFASDSI